MSEEIDSSDEAHEANAQDSLSQSVRLPKTKASFKDQIQEKLDQKFQELINSSLTKLFD